MLSIWGNFYVIVGAAGGALIGLQFVVITLISSMRRKISEDSLAAFATPTVVHFSVVLFISALMSVPWSSVRVLATVIGVCGILGLVYFVLGVQRSRKQTVYQPVFEDWLWYAILPGLCYGALVLAAALLLANSASALYVIGGVTLALLMIGIHNAWDTVVHLVTTNAEREKADAD